jgi:hypothetical protein
LAIKKQYFKKRLKYLFDININFKKGKFIFVLFGLGIRFKANNMSLKTSHSKGQSEKKEVTINKT